MDFKNSYYFDSIIFEELNYTDFIKKVIVYDKLINFDVNKKYVIFGKIEINTFLRFKIDDEKTFMFLIKDDTKYYISIGYTLGLFWYEIQTIQEFDLLYETFNKQNYHFEYEYQMRYYMGNFESLNLYMEEIENYFLLNNNCEKLFWGSKWIDHPFRKQYLTEHITYADNLYFSAQAMKQEDNCMAMNVYTKYSKSLITIENHDNTYILSISFNKTLINNNINNINKVFGQSYINNMPMDIIACIINFPAQHIKDIITKEPFDDYCIYIIELLATNYNDLCEIENELREKIVTHPELENELQVFLDHIDSTKLLNDVLNKLRPEALSDNYSIQEVKKMVDNELIKINGYNYPSLVSYLDTYVDSLYEKNE